MLVLRATIACAALATLAACGGNPARSYAAPAPAGALDCALRTMVGLGYNPVQGGVADAYIKFDRQPGSGIGRVAASVLPGIGRGRVGDHITVTSAGETLRINAVGYEDGGKLVKPSDEAIGHAEAIMATCANPATNQVGAP